MSSSVEHPDYYGGVDNPYEAIKVIADWIGPNLTYGFCVGNALKYICRAGKKDSSTIRRDLEKARWYIDYALTNLVEEDTEAVEKETKTKSTVSAASTSIRSNKRNS